MGCRRQIINNNHRTLLRIHSWSRFFDPKLISKFEESSGCVVITTTFQTNEELFTALDSNPERYDVVTPSSYMAARLARDGRLAELPRLRNAQELYLVAGREVVMNTLDYAVPYSWSISGIAYLANESAPKIEPSWQVFDQASLKKRFTLLEDMRELLGAGLKSIGKSANGSEAVDLENAFVKVEKWIDGATMLETENYLLPMNLGETVLAHAYNGDVWMAAREQQKIKFIVPEEGSTIAVDQLCISAESTKFSLALEFIRFMQEPEHARQNMEWSGYISTNESIIAKAPESLDFLSSNNSSALARSEIISDLGEASNLWETTWQRLFEFA